MWNYYDASPDGVRRGDYPLFLYLFAVAQPLTRLDAEKTVGMDSVTALCADVSTETCWHESSLLIFMAG